VLEFNGKQADYGLDKILLGLDSGLLMHVCCGPCATSVVERVLPFIKPVLYYYNPNIYPESEYYKRLEEVKKVALHFGVELIYEPYDESEYLREVLGYEAEREGGARCEKCFSLRLNKTAKKAKELGVGAICSTLTVSPHKNAPLINEIGIKCALGEGVTWVLSDFKKRSGYLRSIEICNELGLYRQSYCGCKFALGEER
jgi:predicted adenine nucleotide alpha hydrolase (AANH) superfamily ATPase